MRFQSIVSAASVVAVGQVVADASPSVNAAVVTDNPAGVVYKATFPDKPFFTTGTLKGNVKGSITALAAANGTGVQFSVDFQNLPTEGGPFLYHIHDQAVPSDGNCTATAGHLDPYNRGETPSCDNTQPASCQVGDLAGKYGAVNYTSGGFRATFIDDYASTKQGDSTFLGNRSIVFHFANTTRITCANFEQIAGPSGSDQSCAGPNANGSASATATGTAAATASAAGSGSNSGASASASAATVTGAASISAVSASTLMVALAAIMMAL